MPYPTAIPFGDVQQVLRIVRGGTLKTEYKQLFLSGYEVQGYLQGTFIGTPSLAGNAGIEEIHDLGVALDGYRATFDAEDVDAAIDPATIILFVQFLSALYQMWKKNHGG